MYKNVLEDFVVKEALGQISRLEPDAQQRISITEVVALSLNHLKPLYATTYNGWLNQRWYAIRTCSEAIVEAVNRSVQILIVGDPLHDCRSLPDEELRCKAKSLIELTRILGNPDMPWHDIPQTLRAHLTRRQDETLLQGTFGRTAVSMKKRELIADVKSYLQRPKRIKKDKTLAMLSNLQFMTAEQREMESYLLKAKLGYSNVMEKIVEVVCAHMMRKWPATERRSINLDEVIARTLNNLPPMYATSERGYKLLRQRAVTEMSHEIALAVREALRRVRLYRKSLDAPLPLQKFEKQSETILAEIRSILQRQDITWENVVPSVAEILDFRQEAIAG